MSRLALIFLCYVLGHTLGVLGGCSTADDCHANGVCTAGVCQCALFWKGPTCGQLALGAAPALHGGAMLYSPNSSYWCAGVVAGDSGGGGVQEFHLYTAKMALNCGLHSWQRNSVIVHAVGSSPQGPFDPTSESLVQSYFSHNPKPIRAPDGTYLIFHIGCGGGSDPTQGCTNGTTPVSPATPATAGAAPLPCDAYGVSILSSPSPGGPWVNITVVAPPTPAPPSAWLHSADNPSPYIFPNGTTWVMFRSYNRTGRARSIIGLARAPHWSGPYTVDPQPIGFEELEDPFLFWQPQTDSFHALFHTMGGCPSVGCHAFSRDGRAWTVSPEAAYNFSIAFDDGTQVVMHERERPHLLLDAQGRPTHLINGVMPPPSAQPGGDNDKSYSIAVPLVYAQ